MSACSIAGAAAWRLTAAGAVLLEHAGRIAWRLELAERQIDDLAAARRLTLRIGSFPTAMAAYLPAVVTDMREDDADPCVLLAQVTPSTLERSTM